MTESASTPLATLIAPHDLARFDQTLRQLRQLNHTALLRYALDVGDHLLDVWYQGDIRIYRDRKSSEHAVFEALVGERREALADLGLSANTLRNYLLAACTWRELPPPVREQLDLTHLHRLSSVHDPLVRAKLAHDAATEGWSARELSQAIAAHQESLKTGHRSRPRVTPKPMRAYAQAFTALRQAGKLNPQLQNLNDAQKKRVREQLQAAVVELQAVLAGLGG
ncbi:MAG: hypothetical protein ACOYOB_13880 [Myxococcota bacterium]